MNFTSHYIRLCLQVFQFCMVPKPSVPHVNENQSPQSHLVLLFSKSLANQQRVNQGNSSHQIRHLQQSTNTRTCYYASPLPLLYKYRWNFEEGCSSHVRMNVCERERKREEERRRKWTTDSDENNDHKHFHSILGKLWLLQKAFLSDFLVKFLEFSSFFINSFSLNLILCICHSSSSFIKIQFVDNMFPSLGGKPSHSVFCKEHSLVSDLSAYIDALQNINRYLYC